MNKMKITKSQLRNIIKEEVEKLQVEAKFGDMPYVEVEDIRPDNKIELSIVIPFESGRAILDGLEDAIAREAKVYAAANGIDLESSGGKDYPEDRGYGRGGDEPLPSEMDAAASDYESRLKR